MQLHSDMLYISENNLDQMKGSENHKKLRNWSKFKIWIFFLLGMKYFQDMFLDLKIGVQTKTVYINED